MTEINLNKAPDSAYIPEGVDPLKSEVPAVTYGRLSEDEISVADKKEEEFKAPPPGSPFLDQPDAIGNQEEVEGALKANPWLNNPSVMAVLFLVMLDYQKNMSSQRFTEANMKIALSEMTYEIGMENADLAKKLKDLEADKQFLEAMGSFANAATAALSGAMAVNSMRNPSGDQESRMTTRQMQESGTRALSSITDGVIKLMTAGITEEQGALEKLKASNETMQQFWSRLIESSGQTKESLKAEMDKVLQQLVSTSSETRNRIQRG